MSIWSSFVDDLKSTLSSAELTALEQEIPGWQALAQTSAGRAAISATVHADNTVAADAAKAATGQNINLSGLLSGVAPKWAGAGHFALRVAEAVVGILFLAIGLNALLHNPAGKAVRTVAAVRP